MLLMMMIAYSKATDRGAGHWSMMKTRVLRNVLTLYGFSHLSLIS